MNELGAVFTAWPIILIGVAVYLCMYLFLWCGAWLWARDKLWLRKMLKTLNVIAPWLPWLFGGLLGALPFWPRPELVMLLPTQYQGWGMVLLGVFSGALYERIWKGFRQHLDAQGIDLDIDLPPSRQGSRR